MAAGVAEQARAFAAAVRGAPIEIPGAEASGRATRIGQAVIEAARTWTRRRDRRGGAAMTATRQVVVHQDDVGMCHGANVAFLELARRGVITSGSVMVPCPWFPEIAAAAAADPALDLGVHLTLTAEKEHYRWGPISGPAPGAGLTDGDGYLWRDVASVRRHADPAAVATRAAGAGRARPRRRDRRHPPRCPHGDGAGAGVLRRLPRPRRRVPAADPAHPHPARLRAVGAAPRRRE